MPVTQAPSASAVLIRYLTRSDLEGLLVISGDGDEGWYIRDIGAGHGRQLWRITHQTATRTGVTNAEGGPGSYYSVEPGETIWACLRRQTPWLEGMKEPGPFQRMIRAPGDYHPRIARPIALMETAKLWLPELAAEQRYITGAQSQLTSLVAQLQAICRVVQPAPSTLSAYGHEIRNLLILAATEVEMHWRGILVANGLSKKQFRTEDYVKLAGPLGLKAYQVRFHPYPDLAPIVPFATWDADTPTQSLAWYAAYNAVKHNREHEFERATLLDALAAVAACAVLLVAQFGDRALVLDLSRILGVEAPDWPLEEMYLMPQTDEGWIMQPHPALS
jgi:hypothetical protein